MSGADSSELAALREEVRRWRHADEAKGRILEVLGRVTAEETLDGICRAIVEGVREVLGFDRVGLFIWDPEIGGFRGTFGTGLGGETTDERHFRWEMRPEYRRQIEEGATFVRGCVLGAPEPQPGEEGLSADLVALRLGGRLYGVLSVDNRITRRPIAEEDLQPLVLLSQILGNAVELSRARAALARSEERFRQVAESSREWIWETDPQGRYTYASPVVLELLGCAPEEVVGRSFEDFLVPEDRPAAGRAFREALERELRVEGLASRQVHRDGHAVHVETYALPLRDAQGVCRGYRGVHRDVTRQRELEAQLRYAQRMEAIGRLAGGIAHDFNNILTSILGGVSLLLDQVGEKDPMRADLEQIRSAAERAAALTRQLLAFSRRQVVNLQAVDLNAVVREMGALLRRVMGEEIELLVDLAPRLGPVRADPELVRQVILQLAVNACEAMLGVRRGAWPVEGPRPAVRRLTIRTGETELDDAYCRAGREIAPGRYGMLVMQDTGRGFPEEVREHLFDPFFTTRELGRGSGLGLAAVYGMVKQMRGHIEVDSLLDRGTTFTVYFPGAEEAERVMPETSPEAAARAPRATVLIVEDEEPIRRLVSRMLELQGFATLTAADGVEALGVAERHPGRIDLVVTDVVMPKLSGRALVEELRKARPALKVLFISGYDEQVAAAGPPLAGEVAFLAKPFTQDVLVRKVREMLSGQGAPGAGRSAG